MPITPTLINGYELWPESVEYDPTWIGGPPRPSLSGTMRRKRIGTGANLAITFNSIGPNEYALIKVLWAQASQVFTIVDAAEGINDTFVMVNDTLGFKRVPNTWGSTALWSGVLRFVKQKAS